MLKSVLLFFIAMALCLIFCDKEPLQQKKILPIPSPDLGRYVIKVKTGMVKGKNGVSINYKLENGYLKICLPKQKPYYWANKKKLPQQLYQKLFTKKASILAFRGGNNRKLIFSERQEVYELTLRKSQWRKTNLATQKIQNFITKE